MGTWRDERADYADLARLLGLSDAQPRGGGDVPTKFAQPPSLAPPRLDADMGGMLLRFLAARTQGRKTMMCTMSAEIASFLNIAVLPASFRDAVATFGAPVAGTVGFDRELVAGLLAIKHGTEVNVLSFAQECRVDESIASSVAFLLASATNDTRGGGAALFSLLTQLDLTANVGFLAVGAEGNSDPRRVLALIAIANRSIDEPAVIAAVRTLARDFAVLHLGGDEPGVASLPDKVRVIVTLFFEPP